MARTWNKSPRASLSADLTPTEASRAPLSAGPGREKRRGERRETEDDSCREGMKLRGEVTLFASRSSWSFFMFDSSSDRAFWRGGGRMCKNNQTLQSRATFSNRTNEFKYIWKHISCYCSVYIKFADCFVLCLFLYLSNSFFTWIFISLMFYFQRTSVSDLMVSVAHYNQMNEWIRPSLSTQAKEPTMTFGLNYYRHICPSSTWRERRRQCSCVL